MKVGTSFGLNYGKLSDLPAEKIPHEMIQWWLGKRDNVMKVSGTPTLRSLIDALEKNGFDGHANKIKERLPEAGKNIHLVHSKIMQSSKYSGPLTH